jgi:tetratricopeptide (TPR) repeat protein
VKRILLLFVLLSPVVFINPANCQPKLTDFPEPIDTILKWSIDSVGYSKYRWLLSRDELVTTYTGKAISLAEVSVYAPDIQIEDEEAVFFVNYEMEDEETAQGRPFVEYATCEVKLITLRIVDSTRDIAIGLEGNQVINIEGTIQEFNIDSSCTLTLTIGVSSWEKSTQSNQEPHSVTPAQPADEEPSIAVSTPKTEQTLTHSTLAQKSELFQFYSGSLDLPHSSNLQARIEESLLHTDSVEEAILLTKQLLLDNQELSTRDPLLFAKLLKNFGNILLFGEFFEDALAVLDQAIRLTQPFAPASATEMVGLQMSKIMSLLALGRIEEAEDIPNRLLRLMRSQCQNCIEQELFLLNVLFELEFKRGEVIDADRLQRQRLQVQEQAYGEDGEELLPTLEKLGQYFALRAATSGRFEDPALRNRQPALFSESLDLYDRAIKIIEDNYGPNDLRLVNSLQGIAQARLMQGAKSKSEQALERALFVIESNPTTDLPDRIEAIIRMGDLYTRTSDKRAGETYLRAWNLMEENPGYDGLKRQAFGAPTRLYPREQRIANIDRRPKNVNADEELFIVAEYTVRTDGKVRDVKLLDNNVHSAQRRRLRNQLLAARFRPRIVNGELVKTENLIIHQSFRVINEVEAP